MEYCKFCGTEIPDGAKICPKCHAEKKTGPSQSMIKGCSTLSGIAFSAIALLVFQASGWAVVCALIIGTLAGAKAATFIFRDRVIWRQPYQKPK